MDMKVRITGLQVDSFLMFSLNPSVLLHRVSREEQYWTPVSHLWLLKKKKRGIDFFFFWRSVCLVWDSLHCSTLNTAHIDFILSAPATSSIW